MLIRVLKLNTFPWVWFLTKNSDNYKNYLLFTYLAL